MPAAPRAYSRAAPRLETRLARWRREYFRSILAEGAARFAVATGGTFFAIAVVDSLDPLPASVRWCALAVLLGVAGGTGFLFVLRPWLRSTPGDLFRGAGERYPKLKPYLVPAWEFSRLQPEENTSRSLAQAHVDQTEDLLGSSPELPAFEVRLQEKTKLRLAVFAVCGAAAAAWLFHASPGVGRILTPWRETALESLISVSPGDARIAWGASAVIEAKFNAPQAAREGALSLWLKIGSGLRASWSPAPWDNEQRGAYSYRADDVTRPIEYQIRRRDQSTRSYLIEPVPFPQMIGAKVRVHLPGRSGSEDATSEISLEGAAEVSALQGSWAAVRGKPSVPLARAILRVSYLGPIEMKEQPSGEYEAGFPLNQDGNFHFELTSADGAEDPHPVTYNLKTLVDEPPTVELLSPAFEVEASPADPLPITYEAHDDYGLSAIDLIYRTPAGEKTLGVKRFGRATVDQLGDYSWDLSHLPIGSRIEFFIRATDNHAPAAQSSLSKKGVVRLVDFQAAHAEMEKQWLSAEKALDQLAEKELAAKNTSDALSKNLSAQERERLKKELENAARELPEAWRQAERALDQTSESMSKDPYANPGIQQQAKALSEAMKSAREESLPKALDAGKQGNFKDAAERHQDLERQARKAKKLLSEGKEVQGLQDFWSQAQRMDQAGSDLSSALSEMAKHPKSISEQDKKALADALGKLDQEMAALKKALESVPKPAPGSPAEARRKKFVVPLNAAQQAASALQKAMDAGDYQAAAKMARQLAEELSRVRQALADAAREAASSAGGGGGGPQRQRPSDKMEAAMAKWQDALQAQSKSLEMAQKLEQERLKSLLDAQKSLLDKLAERQRSAVDKARRMGGVVPVDVMTSMSAVLNEFQSKSVVKSPQMLPQIVQRIGAQKAQLPKSLQFDAPKLEALAQEEQSILDDLNKGVSQPNPSDSEMSDASAASALQGQARQKTQELGQDLESIRSEVSTLPQKVMDSVDGAQTEQSSALGDLKGLDAPSAVKHESKATEMLDQGMKEMSQATEQQKKMEAGMSSPFDQPGGGRPGGVPVRRNTGSDTGFVPLPGAKDYQPPEEIRRNLEQSLQEKRPKSYDQVIKDYFKRISQ